MGIAERHGLPIVEDACQAILANIGGRNAGCWGKAGAFSLHPLKNLNVWGDAGMIVTDDDAVAHRLRLLNNHGMKNRDEIEILGYNSRLDSLQALVGNWLIGDAEAITAKRIENALYYDKELGRIAQIRIPPRVANMRQVYHLYIVFAEDRDGLYDYLLNAGIECKIHYPIPLYQQEALRHLGYPRGAFPVTDRHVTEIITFPTDQHLSREEQDYVIDKVRTYYAGR
jgi:dTDP-4-amino-4,6-dideoxygalactose transaminase